MKAARPSSPTASDGVSAIGLDVLIVGGGIQGVTLLHELTAAGARRVLLASEAELGVGESLHSHGYLHHGHAMSAAGTSAEPLVAELREAAAWWRGRLRPPYEPGPPVHHALPAEAAAARLELWDRLGLPHRELAETPRALVAGAADGPDVHLVGISDRLVSMRDILADLATPLQDRIVRARLTDIELDDGGSRVVECTLSSGGGAISVRPRMVLLACGRQAQPLLRRAHTRTGHRPLESRCAALNRIRYVPMLLVCGERLPQISGIFETHGLTLFTHPVEGDESMWILTLSQGHRTDRGDFDPRGEQEPGDEVVAESVSRLTALVPEARRRRDGDLRFAFYFGGKTDHPDGGNGRYVDDCGLANLRLAWPGVWSLSLINARQITNDLRENPELADIFGARGASAPPAAVGLEAGVPVGPELRLTSALPWRTWSEWSRLRAGRKS